MIPHASSYYVCELCEQLDDTNGVAISYESKKIYNTMIKRYTIQWPKDIQYNGQKIYNTMAKRKRTKDVWLFFVREETYYVCPLSAI